MSDFRAFCRSAAAAPTELILSPEESHHLVVVNRARAGATVVVFDGRGHEWTCELTSDRKNAAALRVRSARVVAPLPFAITLGQALPKGPGMDAIVRKATEIGAARIVPLESERTQVHLDGDRSDKKIEKWQTAALGPTKLTYARQFAHAFIRKVRRLFHAQPDTSVYLSARPFAFATGYFCAFA
eukprot:gene42663-57753_t